MRSFVKPFTKTLAMFMPAAILLLAPLAFAADKPDPVFAKWWQKFQVAAMRRDIRTIDKGAEFPMDWQISADLRAIRSESDFAANFGLFFTPDVFKNVAAGKPEKAANGNYVLVWKTSGKEYSLSFRFYNGTYVMDSLVEGHP
jgi:hypothetical protein